MGSSPVAKASSAAARRAEQLAAPRLARELKTIEVMLGIYCRDHHDAACRGSAGLCADCAGLHDYARNRLAGCTYGAEKPTCVNCQIHCYARRQREDMRTVMRYAGPRMLWRHPVLAVAHLVDGRRAAPPRPNAQGGAKGADPASEPRR
jgi:hypothetical protein